ncbi:FAD-dependent oxidoreductase [Rhodocytophaga rosea]|uniref:FAD-dependent oxidoreductase n=1 Tax=Rhodocytophaga rosea TaxID=2704465 RepID=A0A6C0GBL5_9BACT|nr:FAD-dependent oxidoreductase [Rhodocytophaga rosea]QHT65335.1 FAD-dependent oxidoreductase [Rhodocytophaga rosea]
MDIKHSSKNYDLIIVGAGPVGLATAYHSVKRGFKVLIVEQFDFLNQLSSSSGSTRQFRLQYAEDYMAKLAIESVNYWDELQANSNEILRTKVGSLWFGVEESNSSEGEIKEAIKTMSKLNIVYESLNKNEIEKNFHFRNLPESYTGFFQKDGGTINVAATIRTLRRLCENTNNITFLFNEKVIDIVATDIVKIKTEKQELISEKLLIAAGPYANDLVKHLGVSLKYEIWQMVSAYFKIKDSTKDLPSWFVYEDYIAEDPGYYYGFENCEWSNPSFLRVAPAFANDIFINPNQRKSIPNPTDLKLTSDWVKKRLLFLDPTPHFITTCLAAIPESDKKKMYLDFLNNNGKLNKNVLIFSCGWAFKYVPILGKICSDLIVDENTNYDISHFGIYDEISMSSKVSSKRRLPF